MNERVSDLLSIDSLSIAFSSDTFRPSCELLPLLLLPLPLPLLLLLQQQLLLLLLLPLLLLILPLLKRTV